MTANDYRRAAMVVASLNRQAADALLDRLTVEQARRIRQAIMQLSDLDAREQAEAVRDFLRPTTSTGEAEAAEFPILVNDSDTEHPARRVVANTASQTDTPLQQLTMLRDEAIAQCLHHERPATVSALLGALDGNKAAGILRLLPHRQQTAVLNLLGQGLQPDEEFVQTIAGQILDQSAPLTNRWRGLAATEDGLEAIWNALPSDEQQAILAELNSMNPVLAKRLSAA